MGTAFAQYVISSLDISYLYMEYISNSKLNEYNQTNLYLEITGLSTSFVRMNRNREI